MKLQHKFTVLNKDEYTKCLSRKAILKDTRVLQQTSFLTPDGTEELVYF